MPSDHTRQVLVVGDRWCDAAPNTSLSNLNHNILGSLECTDGYTYTAVFTDEVYAAGQSVDDTLNRAVAVTQPDLIFLVPMPGHPINPSRVTLESIRMKWQIPIAAMYWDTALPRQVMFADELADVVDVNIAIDCYTVYPQVSSMPGKWLPLWTPQDTRVFYRDDAPRDIDVSFIGSVDRYQDRRDALAYLAANGIHVHVGGGQREGGLPVESYANLLRRSKISLNFSKVFAPGNPSHQFKGRVLESMLCGALVLEPNNKQTPKWFAPGREYDTFGSGPELIEKIKYYTSNDAARQSMAAAAFQKASKEFSATMFWDAVFDRVT